MPIRPGTKGKWQKRKNPQSKKAPRNRILSVEALKIAIPKYRGNLSKIAAAFKITRGAVESYCLAHGLRDDLREARKIRLDVAESGLDWHLDKKSIRAIEFALSTLGKHLGYIKQLELSGADPASGALPISITIPGNGREVNPKRENKTQAADGATTEGGDASESLPIPDDSSATGTANDIASCPADIAVFGGSAGGGKTFSLLLEGCRNLNLPRYGATFLRRTYSEITEKGGAWDKSTELFYPLGGVPNYSEKKWYFVQGSTFNFKHLQHEKHLDSLGSSELPLILIDEATSFTERMIWALLERNRSDIDGFNPYMRLGCNPDPDHFLASFLEWWIDQETGFAIWERAGVLRWFVRDGEAIVWFDSLEEAENSYPSKRGLILSVSFIPSRLSDNAILEAKDPRYRAKLESLPFVQRMRKLGDELLGGNWKVRQSSGMVQREWLLPNIREAAPPATRWVRYWDTAATGEKEQGSEQAAYTCGVLIGRYNRQIWIGDVTRRRVAGAERDTLIKGTADFDRQIYGHVPQWLEQEPGGGGKTDARANVALLIGHDVQIEKVNKRGDKVTRFGPFARQCEAGNVYLVRGGWNLAYVNELEAFPMAKLKDQADASGGGFDKLIEPLQAEVGDEPSQKPQREFQKLRERAF